MDLTPTRRALHGVSPGDTYHPEPYAYVTPPTPRECTFWTAPFGVA